MLLAFLLHFIVIIIHRTQEMFDVVYESLAICKTAEQEGLSAVGTLRLALLDPGSKAVLAGQFTARWAHSWLFYVLKANVALQEG
jgi:hypothetical protein